MNGKNFVGLVFLLLGGFLILFTGVVSLFAFYFGMMAFRIFLMFRYLAFAATFSGIIGILTGLVIIYSALEIQKVRGKKVEDYAVIALIASIISLLNTGGMLIGFIFALIGSISYI